MSKPQNKKNSIGIDGNEANVHQRVGSNVFSHQLIKAMGEQQSRPKIQVYLKSKPVSDMPKQNTNFSYKVFGPTKAWTQWRLPLDLYLSAKPNVFFSPGHYAPRFSPVPTAITILDLAYLNFSETYSKKVLSQLTNWTKYSVNQAKHIFAISQSTKNDIVSQFSQPPSKISVIYPASSLENKTYSKAKIDEVKKIYSITKPYFIFVGTKQPRKNLEKLIKAFQDLNNQDISLVIVGKTWHQFSQLELKTTGNIKTTGYISQEHLQALMQGSISLVFPSLYEGFGIPVLEAMQNNVLVAASNNSSIPEITGKSSLLFNPQSSTSITSTLKTILSLSPQKRTNLIKQGKIRASQFSWEKTAKKTLEVLNEIAV